jgi:hypothetical protein
MVRQFEMAGKYIITPRKTCMITTTYEMFRTLNISDREQLGKY